VRAHPFFDTVEIRVCDMTTRIDDTVAIAALIQAVMGKLYLLYRRNLGFRNYKSALIEENKWRAVRYGLDGQLIDFGKREQLPTRDLIVELLDFVAEAADIFRSHDELDRIRKMLAEGTSADRQLRIFRETQSLQAVVDDLIEQSSLGA
jgi:carboxylate-amine ligase